jgi:hypothetical protein
MTIIVTVMAGLGVRYEHKAFFLL